MTSKTALKLFKKWLEGKPVQYQAFVETKKGSDVFDTNPVGKELENLKELYKSGKLKKLN